MVGEPQWDSGRVVAYAGAMLRHGHRWLGALALSLALLPATPASPARAQSSVTQVSLETAGTGRREVLRYSYIEGATQAITMDMGMEMRVPGMPATPPVRMQADMEMGPVARSGGNFRIPYRYTGMRVAPGSTLPPEAVRAMNTQLGHLAGVTGSITLDTRGRVLGSSVNTPPTLPPQLAQQLESMSNQVGQMAPPMPEEPVGVGARWSAVSTVRASGVSIQQTATMELVERSGDRVRIRSSIVQRLAGGPQRVPGPAGVTVRITSIQTTGTAELRMRMSSLAIRSTGTVESDIRSEATVGGRTQRSDIHMRMEISLGPPARRGGPTRRP